MLPSKNVARREKSPPQDREQLLAVPRQDPHHEHRVAEVPGDVASEPAGERPGGDERERHIGRQRVPRTAHQSGVGLGASS